MSELPCSDFVLPVLLPFIKVSMYIGCGRGSPNGTIGKKNLNDIGIPLVPLGKPRTYALICFIF